MFEFCCVWVSWKFARESLSDWILKLLHRLFLGCGWILDLGRIKEVFWNPQKQLNKKLRPLGVFP